MFKCPSKIQLSVGAMDALQHLGEQYHKWYASRAMIKELIQIGEGVQMTDNYPEGTVGELKLLSYIADKLTLTHLERIELLGTEGYKLMKRIGAHGYGNL